MKIRPALLIGLLASILLVPVALADEAARSEAIEALRQLIEGEFRARTGLGFESFDCELGTTAPTGVVECTATDEEGDAFTYLLSPDEDGQHVVRMITYRPEVLGEEARAALEAPCLRILEGYQRSAWKEIWEDLGPSLREQLDAEALAAELGVLREALGRLEVGGASTVSTRAPGGFEFQYVLPAETGTARFRCGVRAGKQPEVVAYLLDVEPGSEVFERLFSARTSRELSRMLGRSVERVEIPAERLPEVGDSTEARAWLADGTEFPVLVQRTGREDDFQGRDFLYAVLDLPLLFTSHLRKQGEPVAAVDCPARSMASGEELSCAVVLESGEVRELRVRREGGEFRVLAFEPSSP